MWRYVLAVLVSVAAAPGAGAATLVVCGGADDPVVTVAADGTAPPSGCRSRMTAVDEGDILWTGALTRAPRADERLVLVTRADGARRVEIRPADADAPRPAALPVGAPLLSGLSIQPYGVEGRADAVLERGSIAVTCRAGRKPAGVVLSAPLTRLPRGADLRLVATHRGDSFRLDATAAGADAGADGSLPATRGARRTAVPIAPAARADAVQFVVQCPEDAGWLALDDLRLEPVGLPAGGPATAWAWDPVRWRDAPGGLIDAAVERGIGRLHVAVEIDGGRVSHRDALARFVRAAGARGVAVDAVEGDPRMVRPAGRRPALARARAIAAYQRDAPPAERLAGVQYDVEPYLLPEFGADPAGTLAAWAGLLRDVSRELGAPIDAVVPFWLANTPEGERALTAVADRLRQVTVMSYRTDPALVTVLTEPILAWAGGRGVPVRVALETGPLRDETEQRFAPAPRGPLALFDVGGTTAVALLRESASGAPAFAPVGAPQPIRAANLSFLGDDARMLDVADDVERRLAAWPAFDGLSLHGLL